MVDNDGYANRIALILYLKETIEKCGKERHIT